MSERKKRLHRQMSEVMGAAVVRRMSPIQLSSKLQMLHESNMRLEDENQQLKQRIAELEWELEGIQSVFATENDDCLIEPFNSENLFNWLNTNDLEQQIKGVELVRAKAYNKDSELFLLHGLDGFMCKRVATWLSYEAEKLSKQEGDL